MEKVWEQIKQELQKQDDWANHWDSWEAWGEEIEGSIKLLSTGIDSLFSAMDSHNQNQEDLRNMMDSLNKKMEEQITPKFDGTKLKSGKSNHNAIQKKLAKSQHQLKGKNCKLALKSKETRRITNKLKIRMDALGEKTSSADVKLQQLYTEFQAIKEKVNEIHNSAQSSTNLATTTSDAPVPEWVLRERKKNNIIIFGLQETDDDLASIKALAGDLALDLDLTVDILHHFRVGTSNSGNVRPLVVKFACSEKKKAMLLKAKKLKGMEKWTGVVVTHDMTKLECQMEKAWELKLRQDAEFMNSSLSAVERSVKFFKVVGGRRERRIACFPIK